MGFGLSIYGMALGFVCAAISSLTGQISVLTAVALYSATGVTCVIMGALLVAWRDVETAPQVSRRAVPVRSTFAD